MIETKATKKYSILLIFDWCESLSHGNKPQVKWFFDSHDEININRALAMSVVVRFSFKIMCATFHLELFFLLLFWDFISLYHLHLIVYTFPDLPHLFKVRQYVKFGVSQIAQIYLNIIEFYSLLVQEIRANGRNQMISDVNYFQIQIRSWFERVPSMSQNKREKFVRSDT